MKTAHLPFPAVLCILASLSLAVADVPTGMNVQGRLTDLSGDPAPAGSKTFTFKIFDQEAGGTEVWPAGPGENQTVVTDADGLWTAILGAVLPLTEAVFQDTTRWLEVTVDDGVNPPEVLSRIKLNTNPYTYRAASAQNSDAVGGYQITDLDNRYVEITGDTMTGLFTVNAPNKSGFGGSIRGNNTNDGNSPAGYGLNTMGVIGDASSNGTEGKFGVVGRSAGTSGGTTGVYGSGEGTGSFNVGVYGSAFDFGAAENYAGYFYFGDISVLEPFTPGDSAVRLPDNSISRAELLDEPGLTQGTTTGTVEVTGAASMIDIATTEITIPAAGYVVVQASGTVFWSGTSGANFVAYQIDESSGGTYDELHVQQCGQDSAPDVTTTVVSFTACRTYFKDAGTHTFRLEALDLTLDGDKGFFNTTITAIYLPTGYGTVTTVVSADDAAQFESARVVTGTGMPGLASRTPGRPGYEVDLRELEVRAARARIEAQERELELARARAIQLRKQPLGSQ